MLQPTPDFALQTENDAPLRKLAESTDEPGAELIDEAHEDFLALVAHELRTPLSAISGWANIIATSDFDRKTAERGIAVIRRNAKAQERIIDDLYDAASIKHDKFNLSRQNFALQTAVEAAVEAALPVAQKRGINLLAEIGAATLPIYGDALRLQQAVGNLLNNAIKFTPVGGSVNVEICAVKDSSQARITVSDTGGGIAPDLLPFVFERLRQGENAQSGLGLGLSIAKHIVEAHNGSLCAASDGANSGATFTIELPLQSGSGLPASGGAIT